MLVYYGGAPTWRLHTGLCKFVQNISTNIWSLGKRTDLKFGEMPYLFISYNKIISWLYTVNGFRIIFLLRDSANQEYAAIVIAHSLICWENCAKRRLQNLHKHNWKLEGQCILEKPNQEATSPKHNLIVTNFRGLVGNILLPPTERLIYF